MYSKNVEYDTSSNIVLIIHAFIWFQLNFMILFYFCKNVVDWNVEEMFIDSI